MSIYCFLSNVHTHRKHRGVLLRPFRWVRWVCRATRHGLLCRATRHGLLLWCPLLHMFRYLCRFDLGRLLHQRSLGRLRICVPVLTQCNAADNHLVFNETVQSLHRIDLACLLYESPPLASCSLCPLPSRRCTISKGCSKSMQHVVTQTIPSTLECWKHAHTVKGDMSCSQWMCKYHTTRHPKTICIACSMQL
jgi:hypothetical protein